MSELGYFDKYGNLIITLIVIVYLSIYVYLTNEYGRIDE